MYLFLVSCVFSRNKVSIEDFLVTNLLFWTLIWFIKFRSCNLDPISWRLGGFVRHFYRCKIWISDRKNRNSLVLKTNNKRTWKFPFWLLIGVVSLFCVFFANSKPTNDHSLLNLEYLDAFQLQFVEIIFGKILNNAYFKPSAPKSNFRFGCSMGGWFLFCLANLKLQNETWISVDCRKLQGK